MTSVSTIDVSCCYIGIREPFSHIPLQDVYMCFLHNNLRICCAKLCRLQFLCKIKVAASYAKKRHMSKKAENSTMKKDFVL